MPSSSAAKSSTAFTAPIPFILMSFPIVILLNSVTSLTSFKISVARYLEEKSLVPVFKIIANKSSVDRLSAPYLINLYLGLSSFGISLIKTLFIFSHQVTITC